MVPFYTIQAAIDVLENLLSPDAGSLDIPLTPEERRHFLLSTTSVLGGLSVAVHNALEDGRE